MIRLFVALHIPDSVKEEIFEHCFTADNNSVEYNWEPKEKIHLTLKFLGDVKEELLPKIETELEFLKNYSSFACTISKFGFFFRDNKAKILWSDLETDKSLYSLVNELDTRLLKYGVEPEKRKFKSHLTLLRIKKPVSEKFIKNFKEYSFAPIKFIASEIYLIQSFLKQSGSEYKILKNYELK